MTASALATGLAWGAAGLVIVAAVGMVAVRRPAARVLIAAVAALLALTVLGAHLQVAALATDHLPDLCRSGAHWLGLRLSAPDGECLGFR